ncbi:MAG TPA: cysteine--1-D-myo-inosityl 2-amino-2-deoxy-alpha-D-glucopyranoside ligase [Actinomycetales bacterium]|nr:cysteine--1-D-myo-inosityl 2-amino-2-deoxy-alpha-D-glucopyranoside ligase [Actinomycetales bacterium]
MRAWPAPDLPALPGHGLPVSLHDTSSGAARVAAAGETAGLYVCGITPYDATHMGHAATYLAFDLLVRSWRDAGKRVRYVQNVTDIDDPLLERADATGQDWRELADRETALFGEDMTALRVIPPDVYLGAVETIPWVVEGVEKLLAEGAAYRVEGGSDDPDGDVYFDVTSDSRFGSVSHYDEATMLDLFAERGGDPGRAGKKHPLDPLLWRVAREGEPSWDGGSLGAGRPGWHIECVAIALRELNAPFDVQGGGSDLIFPHHEMGSSHAHVLTRVWPYARTYVHAGMVGLDGEKMSKSKGNLVLVSKLRADGVDPMAIRLAVLAHHYRCDWSWTKHGLQEAIERLARWRDAVSRPTGPDATALLNQIRHHLADDLDAPSALGAVDQWVDLQRTSGGENPDAPALVTRAVDALLGVRL